MSPSGLYSVKDFFSVSFTYACVKPTIGNESFLPAFCMKYTELARHSD